MEIVIFGDANVEVMLGSHARWQGKMNAPVRISDMTAHEQTTTDQAAIRLNCEG